MSHPTVRVEVDRHYDNCKPHRLSATGNRRFLIRYLECTLRAQGPRHKNEIENP